MWTLPEMDAARTILLYASMGAEVPTDGIAQEALRRGITVTYPRCLPDTYELALHSVTGITELLDGGAFGIREPPRDCPLVGLPEIDIALVPGLAWDRQGGRLGRGAGYYDRLLAQPGWRALRCGLLFSAQEVPSVPRDSWDVPLDLVVTEDETLRFGGSAQHGS